MSEENNAMIMTAGTDLCFEVPHNIEGCFWQVNSGGQALELMRLVHVDLFVTSLNVTDMDVWDLIIEVKNRSSATKWALFASWLNQQEEVHARTLGVLRIFYVKPTAIDLYEIALKIRRVNLCVQQFISPF